jgi:hypothetical protein
MNGKITKATFKSFVKKNPNLFIKVKSSFDGMTDCVEQLSGGFVKATNAHYPCDNNLGIQGVWLVGNSRDSFRPFNDGKLSGIEVYNCCGSFIVATVA